MGGLVIGQEIARQLGLRFVFVEKESDKVVMRRGFKLEPGEKVLITEDVVTKGGRVQETIDIVESSPWPNGHDRADIGIDKTKRAGWPFNFSRFDNNDRAQVGRRSSALRLR